MQEKRVNARVRDLLACRRRDRTWSKVLLRHKLNIFAVDLFFELALASEQSFQWAE